MKTFIIAYLFPCSVALIVLYGVYFLCLRNEANATAKRFYLLASLLFACVLPFITIRLAAPEATPLASYSFSGLVSSPIVLPQTEIISDAANAAIPTVAEHSSFTLSVWHIIAFAYLAGLLLSFVKSVIGLVRIVRLRRQFAATWRDGIVYMQNELPHFSFLGTVFINSNDIATEDDVEHIILHERSHNRQKHWLDLILIELVGIVHWYNPICRCYRHALKETHEYLADRSVVSQGVDRRAYSELIFRQSTGIAIESITNQFNYSPIKNRITMIMNNEKRTKGAVKLLFAVPAFALLLAFFACESKPKAAETTVEEAIDLNEPQFPGGKAAMEAFIEANKVYPPQARANGYYGRVEVHAYIDKEGNFLPEMFVRSADSSSAELIEEATRIVKKMPQWKWHIPQYSIPNSTLVIIPIYFDLPEAERYNPPSLGRGNIEQNIQQYLLNNVDMKEIARQTSRCFVGKFVISINEEGFVSGLAQEYIDYVSSGDLDDVIDAVFRMRFVPAHRKGKTLPSIYTFDFAAFINPIMDEVAKEK